MTTEQFRSALERGIAAHQARHLEDAIGHYRTALAIEPGNANALSFAGLALAHLGRFAEAEPLLRQAIAAGPDQAVFRFNLVELLEHQGRFEEAVAEIQKVVDREPNLAHAWEKLGDIAVGQRNLAGADRAYTIALQKSGGGFSAAMKQARVQGALGNFRGAMTALMLAEQAQPGDERVLALQAELLSAQSRWDELAALSRAWAEAAPKNAAAWRHLAAAAYELGRYREAADAAGKLLELAPRDARSLAAYGQTCLQADDFAMAGAAFDEAEALAPGDPEMLAGKARLLTFEGRFADAQLYARRAIAADPARADAYWALALLDPLAFEPSDLTALGRLAGDERLAPDMRAMAAFAKGHGHEARAESGAAFASFEQAHAVKRARAEREGIRYDRVRSEAHFDSLMQMFASVPAGGAPRHEGPRPIFVVGMPRSGTTLVDSMLSAHSRVHGTGERPRMQQILGHYLAHMQTSGGRDPDENKLREWANAYYQDVRDTGGADHTSDKYPLNLEAVGLIARVFPDAVIVHTRRNPMETGLSIWRHEFPKQWSFTNRLEDIGHYYGQYARLAAHWQRVLGPRFVTVQYEDLAADFDASARRIVETCGLGWEDACARFGEAGRPIATLSAVQVRKPVAPASPRAPLYAEELRPLAEALEKAGVDLATGAPIED